MRYFSLEILVVTIQYYAPAYLVQRARSVLNCIKTEDVKRENFNI